MLKLKLITASIFIKIAKKSAYLIFFKNSKPQKTNTPESEKKITDWKLDVSGGS